MPVELPGPLLKAVKDRTCIPVIGSRLSAMVGYPIWSGLVQSLVLAAEGLPYTDSKRLRHYEAEHDYSSMAEYARSKLDSSQFRRVLRQQLGEPAAPSPAHRAIARTDYRGLITTNYDKLLETFVTHERKWAPNTFTPELFKSIASALSNPEFFIFKLHGDIDSPESTVFTDRDYERFILFNTQVTSFLQVIFLNYTLLFVGYRLHDPDFQLLLRKLGPLFGGYTSRQSHFAFLSDAGEVAQDEWARSMGIQPIAYPPEEDQNSLTEMLKRLRKEAPYSASGAS